MQSLISKDQPLKDKVINLPQKINHWAQANPDHEVLVFVDDQLRPQTYTYRQVQKDMLHYGHLFHEQGIKPGQLLLLVFPHSYDLVVAFLGAMFCGAIPTIFPYPTVFRERRVFLERLQQLVSWAGVDAIVTTAEIHHPLLAPAIQDSLRILTLDEDDRPSRFKMQMTPYPAQAEDIAYIQFSSGTTDKPNGVCLSHRAIMNNIAALSAKLPFMAESINVGWLPFYHDMGLVTELLLPLAVGGKSITVSPADWVRNPGLLLQLITHYRGTMSWMPNFGFAHCNKYIDDEELSNYNLETLITLGCGGEPIQPETMETFLTRFQPCGLQATALMAGYGMAENVVCITLSPVDEVIRVDWFSQFSLLKDQPVQKLATDHPDAVNIISCGIPLPGVEVAIAGTDDRHLPEDHLGEIIIRGTSLFSNYFQRPEFTAQAQRGCWFHTGDLGLISGGELYVVDRLKDLIIVGGRNIQPQFIERIGRKVLGQIGRLSAAFGIYDPELGTELPVIVCEIRQEIDQGTKNALEAKIRRSVQDELDVFLANVCFLPPGSVVLTTSGKISRRATRNKYLQKVNSTPIPQNGVVKNISALSLPEIESLILRIFSTIGGKDQLKAQINVFDQGVDSLTLVQILNHIEDRFGMTIPVQILVQKPTVAYLAQLIYEHDGVTADPIEIPVPSSGENMIANRPPWISRIKRRFITQGPTYRQWTLSYKTGTRILRQLVNNEVWQKKYFAPEIKLLQDCIPICAPDLDPEVVIAQSLMTNIWYGWRVRVLSRPGQGEQWLTIKGANVIANIRSQGWGIILATHHTRLKRLLSQLPIFQGNEIMVVGNSRPDELKESGLTDLASAVNHGQEISRTAVRSAQIYHAQKFLDHGGICMIFSDDVEGHGGWRIPFHGRIRPFRPGVAELAVRTNALLVPVFPTMATNGHVTIEFLPPLQATTTAPGEQIEELTRQYAAVLEERWRTDLGNLEWKILKKHQNFPSI